MIIKAIKCDWVPICRGAGLTWIILTLGCAQRAVRLSPQPDSLVSEALMAQVDRPGGCSALYKVDRLEIHWFPEVTLFAGECWSEHGHVLRPVAGKDREGQIFVLGSEAGFTFLRRLHPPSFVDSSDALRYSTDALILTGDWPPNAVLVRTPSDIPVGIVRLIPWIRDSVSATQTIPNPGGFGTARHLLLLGVADSVVLQAEVIFESDSGYVSAIEVQRWPRR